MGSKRVNCETCRPPRKPAAVAEVVDSHIEHSVGPIQAATVAELEGLDGPLAALAIHLAEQLDRGGQTGSQVASLARELRSTIAEATKGRAPVADALDELRSRRAARGA